MAAPLVAEMGALLFALSCAGAVAAAEPEPLDPKVVLERWHGRLDQRHFSAEVELVVEQPGHRESRRMTIWRDDEGTSEERLMVRFRSPPDLRNVGLLYFEHADRPNDYFLYQPTTRRVRRLPESLVGEEVYGVDLEFLGFGVAHTEPTRVETIDPTMLGDRPAYKLVERSLRSNARFDRRSTWLDAETFVALRTEHLRGGRRVLVARVVEQETYNGVRTPTRVLFERDGGNVELRVTRVDYDSPIPEEYFSIVALVRTSVHPRSD